MKIPSAYKDHNVKTSKQLEKHFKGISSHRRVDILLLIKKSLLLSLDNITEELDTNYKTTSVHVARLVGAGLISKGQKGENAEYSLTSYGKLFCNFIEDFMYQ